MKLFLLLSDEKNCPSQGLEVSTLDKGKIISNPFFVIDPFDRSINPMNFLQVCGKKTDHFRKFLKDICEAI
jgi:hypothetical protein